MQDAFDDDTIAMLDQKTGTKPATATSTAPALNPPPPPRRRRRPVYGWSIRSTCISNRKQAATFFSTAIF